MSLSKQAAHKQDLISNVGEMQHRHFATVAFIIRRLELPEMLSEDEMRSTIARQFADHLEHSNPRFDRGRFLRACAP